MALRCWMCCTNSQALTKRAITLFFIKSAGMLPALFYACFENIVASKTLRILH